MDQDQHSLAASLQALLARRKDNQAVLSQRLFGKQSEAYFRLPLVYSNNHIVLTGDDAWTGVLVDQTNFAFKSEADHERIFGAMTAALNHGVPSGAENAGHLIISNRVHAPDMWEHQMLSDALPTAQPSYPALVHASAEALRRRELYDREVDLYVRLGDRGRTGGWRGWLLGVADRALNGAGDDRQPDEVEVEAWNDQADQIRLGLRSTAFQAQPLLRRDTEWLVRNLASPALPTPDLSYADEEIWDAGAWRTVLSTDVRRVTLGRDTEKHLIRALEVDGPHGTSYVTYLAMTGIPKRVAYDLNWLALVNALPFPVDVSLYFEIIRSDRAKKDFEKAISKIEAQRREDSDAKVVDDFMASQHEDARAASFATQSSGRPTAYWQCVFALSDTSKDELKRKVVMLTKLYEQAQFTLEIPGLDQRDLFYQQFPGSMPLVDDWVHRTSVEYLAASGAWFTAQAGARGARSMYLGYTLTNAGQPGSPVFYDLLSTVDDEGKAPVGAVVASPGGGKTVSLGAWPILHDAKRGVTQYAWDPKGDLLPLKRWAKPFGLIDEKVKVVDLLSPRTSVSLDPAALAEYDPDNDRDERFALMQWTLSNLCRRHMTSRQENVYRRILDNAIRNALTAAQPRSELVIDWLAQWGSGNFTGATIASVPDADLVQWRECSLDLYHQLNETRNTSQGRLLFANPYTTGSFNVESGDLVIFVAMGLKTTQPNAEPDEQTIIGDTISGLMADLIRSLLYRFPDDTPKSITFDEYHVVKRLQRVDALIDWLKRIGRSKRTAVRLLSQYARDIDPESLVAIWCGRAETRTEAEQNCALLGIEASEANVSTFLSLGPGQFVFRDPFKRVVKMKVDIWDDFTFARLETDARTKARMLAELVTQQKSDQLAEVTA